MNELQRTKLSKFLSLILRHEPEKVGLTLDEAGWVSVDALLAALAKHGRRTSLDDLKEVVETNSKKRFAFSDDGARIRASQGHSVDVDLGYAPAEPPEVLFHGTPAANVPIIMKEGLDKRNRHHVHLSADTETATKVGMRRGKPMLLAVDAAAMRRDGISFFLSANGVWLTEAVPAKYLSILSS